MLSLSLTMSSPEATTEHSIRVCRSSSQQTVLRTST